MSEERLIQVHLLPGLVPTGGLRGATAVAQIFYKDQHWRYPSPGIQFHEVSPMSDAHSVS
jgi:hypothetical protein